MGKGGPRVPKMISLKDERVKDTLKQGRIEAKRKRMTKKQKEEKKAKAKRAKEGEVPDVSKLSSSTMFFNYNQALGPPYHVICDTNFINFAIKNKLEIKTAMMDCLLAKCIPYATECVVSELQKLGAKYRVALRIVRMQFEILSCSHKGTYADDCIYERVRQHKCYIVATCDKELKRRIRKLPGVPIMYIKKRQFAIERMPDNYGSKL